MSKARCAWCIISAGHAGARQGAHPDHQFHAAFAPAPFLALYNASKAFLHSFSFALRGELKDSGVTVTCLLPA